MKNRALYRTDYMLKYLKANWKYWDDKSMDICKQHDGYGFHLYVAVNNELIHQEIRPNTVDEDLKKLESHRRFKIERIIKDQL